MKRKRKGKLKRKRKGKVEEDEEEIGDERKGRLKMTKGWLKRKKKKWRRGGTER